MTRETIISYLRRGVLAGIFLVPFIPLIISNSLFFPYITGKNFAFRIIVEIVVLLWFALALLDAEYRPKWSFTLKAFLVFVGIIFLADLLGVNPLKSFLSNYERMDGFITLAHLALYFVVTGTVLTKEKLWKAFFHLTMAISLYISAFGLLQLFGKIVIQQGGDRIDTTLGNAIYAALFGMFNVFLALYYLVREKKKIAWRIGYALVIVSNLFVIIFAASRGVALGLMGGLFVSLLIIALFEKERKGLRKIAIASLVFVMVAGGVFVSVRNTSLVQKNTMLNRLASISLSEGASRFRVWGIAWKGFEERPLLGWGQGNFDVVFDKYYDPRMYAQEQWFDRAHNIFFDWLIAGGIFGIVAYFVLFFGALVSVWRAERGVFTVVDKAFFTGIFTAYLIQNFFVFDNITSYVFFTSLLGYIHLKTSRKGEESKSRVWNKLSRNSGVLITCATIATGTALILFTIRPLQANRLLMRALHTELSGGIEESTEFFRKITSLRTMGVAEAREQLVQKAISVANDNGIPEPQKIELVELAISEMKKQAELTPRSARYPYFLGALLHRVGRPEEGLVWLQKTLELSPNKQQILNEIGMLHYIAGKREEALSVYKLAYEVEKSNLAALIRYAIVAIHTDHLELADEVLISYYGSVTPMEMQVLTAYYQTGHYDRVVAIWKTFIEGNPRNAQYLLSLAATYATMGDYSNAITTIERVVALEPTFRPQADELIGKLRRGINPLEQ